MRPYANQDILQAFPAHERRKVILPAAVDWANCDFIAWSHRSGHLSFLMLEIRGELAGMVLERTIIRTDGTRRFMCDLCCTIHGQGGTASFTRWNRGRTIARTVMLCADLQCSAYVRGLRNNDCIQMSETLSSVDKTARLLENLDTVLKPLRL